MFLVTLKLYVHFMKFVALAHFASTYIKVHVCVCVCVCMYVTPKMKEREKKDD